MSDNPMFDEIGVDGKKGTYKFGDWKQYAVHSPTEIKGFFGPARWLSNFHLCLVSFDGAFYPSAENAYQSAKVIPEHREGFQTCTPAESKTLWKDPKLTRIYTAEEWDTVKYDIMLVILMDKFYRNIDLRKKLLLTGKAYLEETNHWNDVAWGVDHRTGTGQNLLGKILMKCRDVWK
jgi:ribA/ribD-fused uncharacterized protein